MWIAIVQSIVFGQLLSAILSGTNIFYSLLNDNGLYPSIFPNALVYHSILLLSLCRPQQLIQQYHRIRSHQSCRRLMISYVSLGCIDLAANIAVLQSFQHTSAISVMIITSTSAIFAMLLSIVIFGRRYGTVHFIGAMIVCVGLIFINYSKYEDAGPDSGPVYWIGTVLALTAALLYALSNVINEYVSNSEKGYPIGALGAMGSSASVLTLIICHLTAYGRADRDIILYGTTNHTQLLLAGFVTCMVSFYVMVPLYAQTFSAVLLNFNLLTADLIVLIFHWTQRHIPVSAVYMIGFILIIIGMAIFNSKQHTDSNNEMTQSLKMTSIDCDRDTR